MHTPVLFLVFNRPYTTAQGFEAIREARPPRLYVAADGPRKDRPGEKERCEQVRGIATAVDWPCELKTLFRDDNLGCGIAVSTAIDWFFENEPEGIILEDDCLPHHSFFPFSEELLERYREEDRVMVISGDYFHGQAYEPEHSYFFSRFPHCWGWASWRRAWQSYDHAMAQWPGLRESEWLIRVGGGHRDFWAYWTQVFDATHAGDIDTWDYQWTFSCWTQNGLTILPSKNLVKNSGFGEGATHAPDDGGWIAQLPLEKMEFPLVHPENILRDKVADRWMDLHVFRTRAFMYRQTLRRIPGVVQLKTRLLRRRRGVSNG